MPRIFRPDSDPYFVRRRDRVSLEHGHRHRLRKLCQGLRVLAVVGSGVVATAPVRAQMRPGYPSQQPPSSSSDPTGEPASVPATPAGPSLPDDAMLKAIAPAAKTLASWSEAVNLLKARSLDLRIAVLDVTKAEAQSRTALAQVLPSLNAGSNYTHQLIRRTTTQVGADGVPRPSTTPAADTLSGSMTLVQPLLNAPAWYALGTAKVSEEIAHLSVEDLKRRLTLGAANAVVAVVTAERVAELNRTGLASALSRLELSEAKMRSGAATSLDVQRARQDVIATRSAIVSGDESLRQAREALGLALGFAEPIGVRPDVQLDTITADTRASCRLLDGVRNRADVAGLEKQRQLAERQIKSVELQFLPTLNLQSGLSTTTPKALTSPPVLWNIQAVLSWSIWDGGARYGALRSARASAEQADARREALERSTNIEVIQARRGVSVATDAVAVATQTRDAAAQIDEMTQKMFRAGMATSLELVVAAAALRQAEINLALGQFNLVSAEMTAALVLASCPW